MRKYLFIVLLVGVCFGQDFLITLDGREFPGKYISHNETTVRFQRDDSKGISSFSIDAIKGIRTANGEMVRLEIPNEIVSTITFKNGIIKTGYIESFSLEDRSDNGKINFKEKISHNYLGYDKSSISLIKSWNEKRLFPFGVIANKETGKYHLSNVRHRPSGDNAIFYDSEIDAEKNKFSSCHACFDNSPMIDDYRLEKALVYQTIIAVQNQNEILYEHKDLERVQNLVEKILQKWPETLKGYDYRIQIIRSERLNAFAIGGGNLYIHSGILEAIESDYELEALLAHEIAHIEKRHTLRQFYLAQKKKNDAAFKALLAGLTVAVLGGSAEQTNIAVNVVSAISTFAAELVKFGYKRELEQEADILAQIYLSENNYDKMNMISLLDKMIAYSVTRGNFIGSENDAYASHPTLLSRIKQVETSEIYTLDNPILLTSNSGGRTDIVPGFFELQINYLFKSSSSHISGEELLYILGDIKNHHKDLAFNIDDVHMKIIDEVINEKIDRKPSIITTKDGRETPINYINHDDTHIKFKYIGKDQIITVPLKGLADYKINDLASAGQGKLGDIYIGGLSGSSINYKSQNSFMGTIKASRLNSLRIFQAIKEKAVMINSIKLTAMVLKNDDANINLDDFGPINAMMEISN